MFVTALNCIIPHNRAKAWLHNLIKFVCASPPTAINKAILDKYNLSFKI